MHEFCVLCLADSDDLPRADLFRTANWGYLRLRRTDYTDAELGAWVDRVKSQKWEEAYVFFKHEKTGTGPRFAARFLELAGV